MEIILQFLGLMEKEAPEEKKFFMNKEDEQDYEQLKKIRKRKRILNVLMKVSALVILISCLYFYKIGRSFKVEFLETATNETVQKTAAGGDLHGAMDDFDKLLK